MKELIILFFRRIWHLFVLSRYKYVRYLLLITLWLLCLATWLSDVFEARLRYGDFHVMADFGEKYSGGAVLCMEAIALFVLGKIIIYCYRSIRKNIDIKIVN